MKYFEVVSTAWYAACQPQQLTKKLKIYITTYKSVEVRHQNQHISCLSTALPYRYVKMIPCIYQLGRIVYGMNCYQWRWFDFATIGTTGNSRITTWCIASYVDQALRCSRSHTNEHHLHLLLPPYVIQTNTLRGWIGCLTYKNCYINKEHHLLLLLRIPPVTTYPAIAWNWYSYILGSVVA